jgi:hypothetical protein
MMPVGGRARDHLRGISSMDRLRGPMFTGPPRLMSISQRQAVPDGTIRTARRQQ